VADCPKVALPFGLFADTNTLDPLDPATLPPEDPPPNLEQYVQDTIGDAGTPEDGFDAQFDDLISILDSMDSILGTLASDLLEAFLEADTIDPTPVGDTLTGFTDALVDPSQSTTNLGTLLSQSGPPAPGGGGGGGGTAAPTCEATLNFGDTNPPGAVLSYALLFKNQLNVPLTIKSLTLTQSSPPRYSFTTDCHGTLQPGQTCNLTINAQKGAGRDDTGVLSVATDDPGSPHNLCIEAGVVASPRGGAGDRGAAASGAGVVTALVPSSARPVSLYVLA
jgi:hypothetical protein